MTATGDAFRFRHPVAVRFRDVDIGGHAHHSAALLYFEEARLAYWNQVVGRGGLEDIDYILAAADVRWHRRVLWPQVVDVGVRVTRLGRKHFDMEYEVRSADGEVLQSGSTTQVMFDYGSERVTRMSEDVRAALEGFDGPFGRGGRRVEDAQG